MRVSSGDSNSVDMPDVRGERFEQAQATLAGEGFSNIERVPELTNKSADIGRVTDQSPTGGRGVSPDERVTLRFGIPAGGGSDGSEPTGGG